MKHGHASVWVNHRTNDLTMWLGTNGFHSTFDLTPEAARRLIKDLQEELDKLPAVVTAADLGIEGAPV